MSVPFVKNSWKVAVSLYLVKVTELWRS